VLAEIRKRLDTRPDHVTISGSGEPTLYSRLEELIKGIRAMTRIPVAVLTNGALLWMPEIRTALAKAHIVMPSLDAGDEKTYRLVNRPCPGISFESFLRGLHDFKRDYRGAFWLEIFLIKDVNDSESEVRAIARIADSLDPDRLLINTVKRPPAHPGQARAVSRERLETLAVLFRTKAEIIADPPKRPAESLSQGNLEELLALVKRRPCTEGEIASGLAIPKKRARELLGEALHSGFITREHRGSELYFKFTG
jgi:wyosine [tRNA(Phe)-imidazoG37] synthetase (radical SAM superfamily)